VEELFMAYNAYSKYQEQSVLTMTPGEMVVRLFEECEKQLNFALVCIEEKNIEGSNNSLQKTQRILSYLKTSLDFKYQVSNGLASLYDFFIGRVVDANIGKKKGPVEEILPLITDLKVTFQQAERLARIK
jgi:flagellar protein FliS